MRTKPVYLNLFTFKFPVTAIISILHRISGVILFFAIPFFLSQLDTLLHFPDTFAQMRDSILNRPEKKIILWITLVFFTYHLFAGIRHLLMDVGCAESRKAAVISSYIVIVLTILSSGFMGYALW